MLTLFILWKASKHIGFNIFLIPFYLGAGCLIFHLVGKLTSYVFFFKELLEIRKLKNESD